MALEVRVVRVRVVARERPRRPCGRRPDVVRVDADEVLSRKRLRRMAQRVGRRPVREGDRRRETARGLERREAVHLPGEPPLRRRGVRRAPEVAAVDGGGSAVDLVGPQHAEGVPLDADDPGRQPRGHVGPPVPVGPPASRRPVEVAAHGADRVTQLRVERGGDRGVVEPARLRRIGLVGKVDALHEVERCFGMGVVVRGELVVERRRVDGVDPHGANAEVPHLGEPAAVVGCGDRQLARLMPRGRRPEVHTG